jgi:hypothetical protein
LCLPLKRRNGRWEKHGPSWASPQDAGGFPKRAKWVAGWRTHAPVSEE